MQIFSFRRRLNVGDRGHRRTNRCRATGIELMEGRLMLSAASPVMSELGLVNLPIGSIVEVPVFKQVTAQPGLAVPDGGFIRISDPLLGANPVLNFNAHVVGNQDRSIDDLLHSDQFTHFDYVISYPLADDLNATGSGLVPRVIDGDEGSNELPSHGGGETQAGTTDSEGGMIAVDALMASLDTVSSRSETPKHGTLGAWKAASQAFNRSMGAFSGTANDDIAGEWARAAIFEIAGSEVTQVETESSDLLSTRKVSPAIRGTQNELSSTNVVTQVESKDHDVVAALRPAITPVVSQSDGALAADRQQSASFARTSSDINGVRAAESNEMFDDLGVDDRSHHLPVLEPRRFSSTLSAVPLLLVFALERVAPRRWGRRQRKKQPQLSRHRIA